jgi:hypothetical protein
MAKLFSATSDVGWKICRSAGILVDYSPRSAACVICSAALVMTAAYPARIFAV